MMLRMACWSVSCAAVVIVLAACGGDDSGRVDPLDVGAFDVVAGALNGSSAVVEEARPIEDPLTYGRAGRIEGAACSREDGFECVLRRLGDDGAMSGVSQNAGDVVYGRFVAGGASCFVTLRRLPDVESPSDWVVYVGCRQEPLP